MASAGVTVGLPTKGSRSRVVPREEAMAIGLIAVLNTYPDPCPEADLPPIVSAATHLGARLTGLALRVDIPDVGNMLSEALLHVREMSVAAERRSRDASERMLGRLALEAAAALVPFETRQVAAAPALMGDAAVPPARFHDFIAVPLAAGGGADRDLAETLVFGSGRPVLLFPQGRGDPPGWGTVAIATDFGRAAARALYDARPFLERAERVVVFAATDEKELGHSGRDDVAAALARMGVSATFEEIQTGDRAIGEALQDHALARGAGLLVMGAYGHSRWREFVLGGATASVLADPRMPVLMSH
jgi:nucleotide-binding universal stress UspA family protein